MGVLLDELNARRKKQMETEKPSLREELSIRKDSANYEELSATNQSAADTINRYQETMKSGGYLSAEDLTAYKSAVDTYTDTGNRMRSVARYFGVSLSDEDVNAWNDQASALSGNYDSAYQYYSKYENEEAWNQAIESQKDTQEKLNANTAEIAIEIAKMKDRLDVLYAESANARNHSAQSTDPTEPISGEWADYETAISTLEKDIADKEAYLADANLLQNIAAIEAVADPNSESYDPDFVSKSAYIPQAETERSAFDMATDAYATDPWENPLYEAINGNEEAIAYIWNKAGTQGLSSPEGENALGSILGSLLHGETELLQMTEDEKLVYNYYANEFGAEKANEYYRLLESDLNARQRLADARENRKRAQEDPVGSSLETIALAPFKWLSYVGQVADYLEDRKIDENAAYNAFAYTGSDIRGEVSKMIEGDGSFWGKVGSWGYQLGMSMGDFVASTVAGGGNEAAVLMIMGSGAAADTTIAAKQRGLSDGQAMALGTIAGAAEVISEKIGYDALMDMALLGKNKLVYVLKNVFSEGLEEPTSSLINTFADVLIAADKSEWAQSVQAYMADGKTQADATLQALLDQAASLGLDALGGMLSGGLIGGGSAAVNSTIQNVGYRQAGRAIIANEGGVAALQALSAELGKTDADLAKLSAKISDKVATGDTRQVGRLYAAVQGAVERSNTTALANKLVEVGYETETAQKVAQVVMEARSGVEMSREGTELYEALKGDSRVTEAITEVLDSEDSAGHRLGQLQEMVSQGISETQGTPSSVLRGEGSTGAVQDEGAAKQVVSSMEGKTFVQSTGEVLENVKFASVEQGKATVALGDGKTASLSDVSFADEGQDLVASGITSMEHVSVPSANGIWQIYQQGNYGNDAGGFTKAAMLTFRAGFMGDATVLKQGDSRSAALDPAHVEMIYQMGREDAEAYYKDKQAKLDAQKKAAAEKSSTAEKKGGVFYEYDGKTIDQRNDGKHKPPTKKQRVAIDFVKRLSKKFGSTFYFYESYEDENGNRVFKDRDGNIKAAKKGFYNPKDGSIHIDLNGDNLLFTVSHELVHFIRDWSPWQFKKMADLVMEGFNRQNLTAEELIVAKQADYAAGGITLTEEEAFEEVIAASLEGIIADGRVLEFLQAAEAKDKNLGAKVRQFFQDIGKLIRGVIESCKDTDAPTDENDIIRKLEDIYSQLKEAFAEGVMDAGTNFQNAENTTGEGGVRYLTGDGIEMMSFLVPRGKKVNADLYIEDRHGLLLDDIRKHLPEIQSMSPVCDLDGTEFQKNESDTRSLKQKVKDFFNGIGNKVFREELGVITINNAGAQDSLEHGYGPLKAACFATLPAVIEKGLMFGPIHYLDRSYDTYLFVAPVRFVGTKNGDFYVGAYVIKDVNTTRYKIHEVLTVSKEGNRPFQPEADQNGERLRDDSLLEGNVTQPETVVKQISTTDSDYADPITYDKDGKVIPLSKRFNPTKRDIRYSIGSKTDSAVQKLLEKENEALREDVARLKELLKLQGTQTHGTKFTVSSVEAAARYLKKNAGAKGDTKALAKLLNSFYEHIATEKELTWESVREQAKVIANWLMDRVEHTRSDYAQEVLGQIRGSRFYLDESQKQEATYRYESYDAYRRSLMGSVTIANDASMSLDSWWHEMSTLYPDVFDADTSAADMPAALADAIYRLRNENSSALEYAHNRRWTEQDLIRDVYDSYWRVNNLRTVADRNAVQINRLKYAHIQQINKLKAENRQKVEQLKAQHRAEVKMIRSAYRQKLETQQKEISARYQESRAMAVEGRHKTEMRHKIQKVVKKLNDLLLKETRDKHVPENLKKVVAEALDAVNMDTVGAEERVARYDALIAEATDPDVIEALTQTRDRIQKQGDRMQDRLRALKDAYEELQNAEGDIANAYDEDLAGYIKELANEVGDTPLRDMTLAQLETVYEVYTAVLTTVRNANKAFKEAKGQSIREMGEAVLGELRALKQRNPEQSQAKLRAEEFFWNNEKPIYAFERIGSKVLSMLYRNLQAGQDTYMTDQLDAKAFANTQKKKHGYDKWDFERRYKFVSSHGDSFELSLSQIMSLYAYAKRDQAREHIRKGGIVFDGATELTKNGLFGVKKKVKVENSTAYNISDEVLAQICGSLTQAQAAFVDEMQRYLSDNMGAKGNEVSMALYGIRLFKEKHYFPLKSAPEYMEKAREQQNRQADVKLKNSGMTKATVPKASNPVVLTPFMDVWADHVVDMSMYHSFVLPLEDFYRVYNFKTGQALEEGQTVSVISVINRAHGKAATRYVDQFLKDLNGGVVADPRESIGKALVSKFKKASVMASASVVVQQPTAVVRAMAMIDARHFHGEKIGEKKMSVLWDEAKKYAPIAAVKEMGYFDTHMGRSARDYLLAKEYHGIGQMAKGVLTDSEYRDELLSKPAAMADQIAWVWIWNAVKRETGAKHPNLYATDRAEFFRIAGERYTDVISRTQVYDSVFSRSANMRSKSIWMNMVTAFMGEPTATGNMLESALRQWRSGAKKSAWRTVCGVYGSVLLNSLVVAVVYAMRDDDEDEHFLEKYATAFTGKLLEGINPMTYFPFVRDIWSLMQGYDVERADMSVLSDLVSAISRVVTLAAKETTDMNEEKLAAHNKKIVDAILNLVDSGFSIVGIPGKNIRRDIMAVVNTWKMVVDGVEFDFSKLINALLGEVKDNVPVVNMLPN